VCENLFITEDLPNPLKQSELNQCFERYKSNGDMEAREKIIEHNIRLVLHFAYCFNNIPCNRDELVDVGLLGLIKSVDTFDYTRGINFSTYASTCIKNEMTRYLRDDKTKNNVSMDFKIALSDKDNKEVKMEDILKDENADFEASYEEQELYLTLHKAIRKLPEREQIVLINYFGLNGNRMLNQTQLASNLGVSRTLIQRILKRSLRKIKVTLYNEYPEYRTVLELSLPKKRKTSKKDTKPITAPKQKIYINDNYQFNRDC